jgi:hypothetical protein
MASSENITIGSLQVNSEFHAFVTDELLPATGLDADSFWAGVESIIDDLSPTNRDLLAKRDALQQKIDSWHKARAGEAIDHHEYVAFLREIGYLVDSGEPFHITTENVDEEIAEIAGPQLVVPVSNAQLLLLMLRISWIAPFRCHQAATQKAIQTSTRVPPVSSVPTKAAHADPTCFVTMVCISRFRPIRSMSSARRRQAISATSSSSQP